MRIFNATAKRTRFQIVRIGGRVIVPGKYMEINDNFYRTYQVRIKDLESRGLIKIIGAPIQKVSLPPKEKVSFEVPSFEEFSIKAEKDYEPPDEGSYACPFCDREFASERSVKIHIGRAHKDEKKNQESLL